MYVRDMKASQVVRNESPDQTPAKASRLKLEGNSLILLAKAPRELFTETSLFHQYWSRNAVVMSSRQVTDFQVTIPKRDAISSPSKKLILTS